MEYRGWTISTISPSPGRHREVSIENEVASERCVGASEVVRDALRHMEDYSSKIEALRAHLAEEEGRALNSGFMQDHSLEKLHTESIREG